ncbi:MAG TPA: SCO1664 family protein [Actinomycetota bacterium]|nr:SCO1664 family protein [Actinomycetota bacterium]
MGTTPEPASSGSALAPADLTGGNLEILGLLPASSNYTFLARLESNGRTLVVYKPRRGETPLWDFPSGSLCLREVAAYRVSVAAGWLHVPSTVLRDGPFGIGMVQQFIEHDPAFHAFNLAPAHEAELKRIAVFDLVANNADRKAGHVLKGNDGRLWAVDHGLCFHAEPKLRTVLWDWVGDAIPEDSLAAVERLRQSVRSEHQAGLAELLEPEEIELLLHRAEQVLDMQVFPAPGPGRPYPWPPI